MSKLAEKVVVLIDDSEDDAFITNRVLKKHGAINRMEHIQHPEKSIEYLKDFIKQGVDPASLIILLDINMPLVSGYKVLEWLRADAALAKIPVVMLSSSTSGGDIHSSLSKGADGFLIKPFDPDALFEALRIITDDKKRLIPDMITPRPEGV